MHHNQAILFLTNRVTPDILSVFDRLSRQAAGFGEAILLYQGQETPPEVSARKHYTLTDEMLDQLGYPRLRGSLIPGCVHFAGLQFRLANPGFDFYWLIENDVRFTGSWQVFFEAFKTRPEDLAAARIFSYPMEPAWDWWEMDCPNGSIPLENRLKAFIPIHRLSAAAARHLHEFHLAGWAGHGETLLPTLLQNHGFSLMDFGGRNPFTPAGWEDRFYTARTMRWRPSFAKPGRLENKLYHPVKPGEHTLRRTLDLYWPWRARIRKLLFRVRS